MLSLILRQGSKSVQSTICLIQKRNFMFRTKTSEKIFRRRDKIKETFSIVYKAPMEYYLQACNYVTSLSAIMFGGFATYRWIHRFDEISTQQIELDFAGGDATLSEQDVTFFALGMVGFAVIMRMVLYKYPLRIYKNNTNFIAIFEGYLPMTKQRIHFLKGEVKPVPPKGVIPWKEHRYFIQDRSTVLFYEYFRSPSEFDNMMRPPKTVK